ncbi:MAG: QueT transporter family protein [candidate division KSB1 bacterium]|nr:QueT transporter family protein [candidate division KSB1 bacterium]
MIKLKTQDITMAAMIGGLYAALTILLAPWSYGPVQVRLAESLTVLPIILPQAIPGLFAGCMLANIYGGYGPLDIFGGSAITLIAGLATYYLRRYNRVWLAPIPPILFNAFGIGYILYLVADVPYWLTALQVGAGQIIACAGIGIPLLLLLKKRF